MFKQVILLRKDLEMSTGKKCVQSCHACLGAYLKAEKQVIKKWKEQGQKKVVLEIASKQGLLELFELAKKQKLPSFLVQDAGLTELEPGTITALAIGPEKEEKIDKLTGSIPLLK